MSGSHRCLDCQCRFKTRGTRMEKGELAVALLVGSNHRDGVLFDLILKAFGSHHEASNESNDDYTPQGVLLSKNYVCPLYVAKDPLYGSWKDSLNVRVSK